MPQTRLQLQVIATPQAYALAWRPATGESTWQPLCSVPTYQLSTESAGGFTGVYLGLYAFSATDKPATADFAWVDFEPGP